MYQLDIFTPTPRQAEMNAQFAWILTNCPDASTICVRILIRHLNRIETLS